MEKEREKLRVNVPYLTFLVKTVLRNLCNMLLLTLE